MARPLNVSPGQALLAVMQLAAGQLMFATNKVLLLTDDELYVKGDVKDSGNFEMIPHKWVALQERLMKQLAHYAKLAADMGIAERQQSMQESQTAMMAALIENVLRDVGLSDKQRDKVGPSIRRHLTLVAGEAA